MTGPQGMGPLIPNITIPADIGGIGENYDDVISTLGAIWYSSLSAMDIPEWPTYSEAVANDEYNNGYGPIFVQHWTDEYVAMEWPTYENAILDNASLVLGSYWTSAYWAQSGQPPYANMVILYTDPIWFSLLGSSEDSLPYGGFIFEEDGYRWHRFTKLIPLEFYPGTAGTITIEGVLIGGGGGGGGTGFGSTRCGGGGAGAFKEFSGVNISTTSPVVIGAGGSGGGTGTSGANGAASSFNGVTAVGGGGGGASPTSADNEDGKSGASGGGGAGHNDGVTFGDGGIATDGFNGGSGLTGTSSTCRAGGGGGSNGPGENGISGFGGDGGPGSEWPIGSEDYYAAGGAGANNGVGGIGGGGAPSTAAVQNTGSGGGGGGFSGGAGARGLLLIRYPYP